MYSLQITITKLLFIPMICIYGMVIGDFTRNKKHLLSVFPNKNVDSFRKKVIQILQDKRYRLKVKKDKLHVEKDSSVTLPDSITAPAVDLFFKQKGRHVEVYWAKSMAAKTKMACLIRPVIPESSSDFVKEEILPILQQQFGD